MRTIVDHSPSQIRILVADDFSAWRAQIRDLLQSRSEMQVIAEACDGREAVTKTTELVPDIALLDIGMPALNGIEAARKIRQVSPSARIVFLTQETDSDVMHEALATGACEYLLKTNAAHELIPAIERAMRNGHEDQLANLSVASPE